MNMKKLFVIICLLICVGCSSNQEVKRPDTYNYNLAIEALQYENYDAALYFFNKELDENPNNGYALLYVSNVEGKNGEYEKALSDISRSLQLLPKRDKEMKGLAYRIRSWIYEELGRREKALADLNSAIELDPDADENYLRRGQLYYNRGWYALSDKDYLKSIELNRDQYFGYIGLGRNANERKMFGEALDYFAIAIQLNPDYSSGYAYRAESYMGLKRYDEAIDDVIMAISIDRNDDAFDKMTELAEAEFPLLKAKIDEQSTREPSETYWIYCLGDIHQQAEQYKKAIEYYKRFYDIEKMGSVLGRIAYCYTELENYPMALKYMNEFIESGSSNIMSLYSRANIEDKLGLIKEAISDMDTFINHYPDRHSGYFFRGSIKDHGGDMKGALEDYTKSITLNPEFIYGLINRGRLNLKMGDEEAAKQDFETVLSLDTIPDSNSYAQYAFFFLGQKDKAVQWMGRILENEDGAYNNYDAACLYSLLGKTSEALKYLENSFSKGFRRYSLIQRNEDLHNIRNLPEFKSLVRKYKEYQEKETVPEPKQK